MTPFKTLAAATLLLLSIAAPSFQLAHAQGTTIIVIDEVRILQDSRAGKDIQTKLGTIETQIDAELEPARRALETAAQSIQPRIDDKTPEVISADAALVADLNAFQQQRQAFAQRRQVVAQEFSLTQQQALVNFNVALEPVVMEVMRERGAQVVLSKDMTLFAADSVDVSADIIAKLDQRTPAIAVTRVRAPAQPQQ